MRKSNGCVFGVDNFSWASLARGNYIDLGVFVHNISLYKRYGGFDEKLHRLVDWDIILLYTKKSTPHFVNSCVLLYDDTNTRTRISNSVELGAAKRYIERKHKIKHTRISTGDRKMFWLKFARFCALNHMVSHKPMAKVRHQLIQIAIGLHNFPQKIYLERFIRVMSADIHGRSYEIPQEDEENFIAIAAELRSLYDKVSSLHLQTIEEFRELLSRLKNKEISREEFQNQKTNLILREIKNTTAKNNISNKLCK